MSTQSSYGDLEGITTARPPVLLPRKHNITREAVVAEALTWEGTAYHDKGRIKCTRDSTGKIIDRGGVDCATILMEVYHAVGAVDKFSEVHYAHNWHLHSSAQNYLRIVKEHSREITQEEAGPGDVVLFQWGRVFSHGAIIITPGWPHIIHSYNECAQVVKDLGTSGRLYQRVKKFFTIW